MKRLVSALMLLLLFSNMIPLLLDAKSVGANITGSSSIVSDAKNQIHSKLGSMTDFAVIDKESGSKQENILGNSGQTSLTDANGQEFTDTSEWEKFAYMDGDKTRLIVGVNGERPTSLLELERVVTKYRAEIVNTISIGGRVRALVIELLWEFVPAFVEEVHVAGLASYVEPNMKVQAQSIPNDPYWSVQWGPQKIEADWAWNTTVGDPSVLVAVVDTGVYYTHPDLAANYIALGYDWVNNDNDPLDDHGHGTHCAGIIAAVLNNGEGIAGLAQVQVMAEKVLGSGGGGYAEWVASGIIHATDCGADIISMSLGASGDSELIHDAVRYAYSSGVLVIAAAGNDNTNMKFYPAGYDEVVSVAATDQYDGKASFSNWGDWIELAAPGVSIYSTVPFGYATMSGTSMACPHVSGIAALVWSRHPSKTRDWVRLWLQYTADDLGDSGFDVYYGYGRVNARKAVEQTPPAHELIVSHWTTPLSVEPEALATINATVQNFAENDETDVEVQLLANGTIVDSELIDFLEGGSFVTVNLLWNPTIEGLYNVTLFVVPVSGETNVANNVVWKYIYVGFPVKAVVLHSIGNIYGEIITNWQTLNNEWYLFGDTMIYIDYTTLNIEDIAYEDIVATEADVLIISCAYDPYAGWEFTDSEIEAITQYIYEGHGLIVTAATLYYQVPNNNKLASLLGLNETIMWGSTLTDQLNLVNPTHPIFTNVPNPLAFPSVGTVLPYDGLWDSNELAGGEYLALGNYQESAIVAFRGLVYISPWLEVIPPYYHYHLQLLYNAIVWSRYHKPEHELMVSLEVPEYLEPGESVLLNATVSNLGLNDETDVELELLVDGTVVSNATILLLVNGTKYTMNYMWTPTVEGIYNVTAHVPPIVGEESTANNVKTKMVHVRSIVGYAIFEEAHLPCYTIGRNPAYDVTGGYSEFARYLTINGYVVSTIDPGTIVNPSVLAPANVLVIVAPQNSYLTSELEAIENWVKSGGNLLLISDWGPFGSQARSIAARFNVNLRGDAIGDSDDSVTGSPVQLFYSGANLLPHSITAGVTRVEMYFGDGMVNAPEDEIPLIVTDSDGTAYWYRDGSPAIGVSVMSAFEGGTTESGRLVVIADSNIWDSAYDVDGDGDVDFYDSDNEILALNSINWLSIRYEHELTVFLEAPQLLQPGEVSLLNAIVYNFGLSNETNVELYLLINGTVVSSAAIPELLVGESHNINYAWTPAIEGMYNVTAYAPPVLNETFIANNKATKFVTVTHPLIHPIEGQYANYTIYYVDPITGEEIFGGLWNFTYVSYISPHQINITTWMKDSYNNTQSSWMIVNIFTRMVERDSGIGWTGMWYLGWIQTNVTIGSTINLLWSNVTVVDDEVICINGRPIDCWEMQLQDLFGYVYAFWYDKASGLWIGMRYASSYGGGSYLILTATNVPIGFMYDHDLAVTLDAPTKLSPSTSTILNATVYNTGLSNETTVTLQIAINGSVVASEVIPELANGDFYTLSYTWTPLVEGLYNVTVYAPPVLGEEYIENNVRVKMVSVRLVTVALISDYSELLVITNILDSMGINYDIYNDNAFHFYTADLALLLQYKLVIFNNHDRMITVSEHSSLESYLSLGGNLIVTGYDSLGHPGDPLLADIVCSSSVGDNTGEPDLIVVDATHPIMNGLYGSFPVGYHITGLFSDCDAAEADVTRNAVTVAELVDGYDKIIATETLTGGKVVFWNGEGYNDWTANTDCQAMFKNMIDWMVTQYEHDLAVSLEAPTFLKTGDSCLLNATVVNRGLDNETNVELHLLIDGTEVSSATIPELLVAESYTIHYLWTPTGSGYYNITFYAPSVSDEEYLTNNIVTRHIPVWFYQRLYRPHEWIGGGIPMGWHADDSSWSYTLPFDFPFYGVYYRTIYISSNGLITFLSPDSSFGNGMQELATKLAIAVAWDDWVTYDPYDIYIWQTGAQVGIRWYVRAWGSYAIANFEVILSANGIIQLNYEYNDGPVSTTIGISNGIGHIIAEDVTNLNHINSIVFTPFVQYSLTVNSVPIGVTFTVDSVSHTTPWSETYNKYTSVNLEMPETHIVGDTRYYWNQWSDGNTSRSRTVAMTTNITLTGHFTGPYYQLTVASSPIGITFTINGVPQTTPYTKWLLEGPYTLEMPKTHDGYVWSHWLEDGDTNRIKTITLPGTTWTAVYVPAPKPPVGGRTSEIDMPSIKPELQIPWIWLSTIILSMVATVVFVKLKKKRQ